MADGRMAGRRRVGDAESDPGSVTEALTTASALLDRARTEAARIREDADRYLRQRELEAEILLGKARRVLRVAEEKAALITSTARAGEVERDETPEPVTRIDLSWLESVPAIPERTGAHEDLQPVSRAPRLSSHLDELLATAVSTAVDRAFAEQD